MQIKKVTASDAQEPAMTLSDPDIPRTNLEKKTALKKPAWIYCLSVKSNLILFKHLKTFAKHFTSVHNFLFHL